MMTGHGNDEFNLNDNDAEVDGAADQSYDNVVQREAAKFILKTRDGKKITQTAMNGVVADTKILIEKAVESLESEVMKKLDEFPCLRADDKQSIKEVFAESTAINPFDGIETRYKQEYYFKEHFNDAVSHFKLKDINNRKFKKTLLC